MAITQNIHNNCVNTITHTITDNYHPKKLKTYHRIIIKKTYLCKFKQLYGL